MRGILRGTTAILLAAALAAASGCAGGKKNDLVVLSADEMYDTGLRQLSERKFHAAIDTLTRIDQYNADNRKILEPLVRLGMADATFYQGSDLSLIDARSLYLDFVTLFGDHHRAPYAQFQAGICSLSQVNNASRDQSQTFQAIRDLQEVERRWPDARFSGAARVTRHRAQENLAEHEFMVGRFYMKKKAWDAASQRFRGLLQKYPQYLEKDKVYFYLGESLVRADNLDEGRTYFDRLVSDYPEGKYTSQALKSLRKAGSPLDLGLGGSAP